MQAAVLDTLRCAQTLKAAGFTPQQAEASAQVLGEALADVATKADVDRLEAKLDGAVSSAKSDLDNALSGAKSDLDNALSGAKSDLDNAVSSAKLELKSEIAQLEAKVDAMDQKFEAKLDAMEQRLDEKIVGKFDSLSGKINVLIGFVGVMLTAVFGFAFFAMAPNGPWAEPQATLHDPASSPAGVQARTAPPEPLSEAQPATTTTFPPTQDTPNAPHARPPGALERERSIQYRPEPPHPPSA